MKWFKFYGQDYLTDIKIMSLSIEDRLCYITLLCLASAGDEPGVITNCTEDGVIKLTHLYNDPYDRDNEYTRAVGCLKRFEEKGMVTVCDGTVTVTAFKKRQEEYSTSAERMRRFRAKNRAKEDNVTVVTSHSDARIEENRKEEYRDSGESQSLPSFEEYLETRPEVTSDYEGDGEVSELVYRVNGKVVSEKKLRGEFAKAHPAPSVRPKKAPRTRDSFDFDTWLTSLKNSSQKADKIVALIWKEKGYRFENYEQWRAQMGQDSKYVKDLVGYSGAQISAAIDRCRKESEKGGYDWKASTVAKKIAEITI